MAFTLFDKKRKFSYREQKHQRYRLLRTGFWVFALYILYNALTAFCFSIWTLENDTMRSDTAQGGLSAGDRLICVSYALPLLFGELRSGDGDIPFKRGGIVLVDTGRVHASRGGKILDGLVRFFTAQRVSVFNNEEHLFIKRIIGLPGDEISMTNFVLRVKPRGASHTLTEFELADKPYYPVIPHVPALWDESIPFSPNMDRILLDENECFVISDDRINTNDSRTWGPVSADSIIAGAVFRFWPLTRMGRP
jgi:signal peptidase I